MHGEKLLRVHVPALLFDERLGNFDIANTSQSVDTRLVDRSFQIILILCGDAIQNFRLSVGDGGGAGENLLRQSVRLLRELAPEELAHGDGEFRLYVSHVLLRPIAREHDLERLLVADFHTYDILEQTGKLDVAAVSVELERLLLHPLQRGAVGAVVVDAHGFDINHRSVSRDETTIGHDTQGRLIPERVVPKLIRIVLGGGIIPRALHLDAQALVIPRKRDGRFHLDHDFILHVLARRRVHARERRKHIHKVRRNSLGILQRRRGDEFHRLRQRVLQRLLHARALEFLLPHVIYQQLHRDLRRRLRPFLRRVKSRHRDRIVESIDDVIVALLQQRLRDAHRELHRAVARVLLIHHASALRRHRLRAAHRARENASPRPSRRRRALRRAFGDARRRFSRV